jgi:hypothetical protein
MDLRRQLLLIQFRTVLGSQNRTLDCSWQWIWLPGCRCNLWIFGECGQSDPIQTDFGAQCKTSDRIGYERTYASNSNRVPIFKKVIQGCRISLRCSCVIPKKVIRQPGLVGFFVEWSDNDKKYVRGVIRIVFAFGLPWLVSGCVFLKKEYPSCTVLGKWKNMLARFWCRRCRYFVFREYPHSSPLPTLHYSFP